MHKFDFDYMLKFLIFAKQKTSNQKKNKEKKFQSILLKPINIHVLNKWKGYVMFAGFQFT